MKGKEGGEGKKDGGEGKKGREGKGGSPGIPKSRVGKPNFIADFVDNPTPSLTTQREFDLIYDTLLVQFNRGRGNALQQKCSLPLVAKMLVDFLR